VSPAQALSFSRSVLANPQEIFLTDRERAAILCLVQHVSALDARLQGRSDGTIPFDGQIHIPKGYVMRRPPEEEAQ